MNKYLKFGMAIMLSIILSVLVGAGISVAADVPIQVVAPFLFVMSLIPMTPKGVLRAGISVEIWQNHIEENLYEGIEFVKYAFNADQYVVGGRIVHIPQAGAAPNSKRNRVNLPAAVTRRVDTDITYAIDEFTTDPVLISNAEEVESSYDKMASVLYDHIEQLREDIGAWTPYNWASTNFIVRTSGDNVATHLTDTTGTRKALTLADFRAAKTKLNKQKGLTKSAKRYALIDADMVDQLSANLTANDAKDYSVYYDAKEGKITKLEGFELIERSNVLSYTNAATPVPKTPDADAANTDNAAIVCWQENAVEKAEGTIEIFERLSDPTMYGDVYSALVRYGGRKRRADQKGTVVIVQSAGA